jgi:chorismate mutase
MAADSFHTAVGTVNDALLSALADRWRELQQAPAISPAGIGFRPAREAAEMRRLTRAATAAGLPADVMARVWRSICGDMLTHRGLNAVYVAGGDISHTLEAARGYFGFGPNVTPLVEVRDALERAATTQGVLACVPWPEHAGSGQWWPMLNEGRFRSLSIVAGWPGYPSAPSDPPRVAVLGRVAMEASGEDDTLATAHDDRFAAERCLFDVGLKAEVVARARSQALIRIRDFVAVDDRRIELARKAGLDGLRVVGVRPRP